MPKKTDRYETILMSIEKQLQRQNSFRFVFMQGLTRGMGTALGATVLVALVTSITIQFTNSEAVGAFMSTVITSITAN
jgi:uncharacterized membrane protein YqjE